ncbi:unnamed protein product [Didymodactylos carnosus]|uniref:Uncharacterized protein n=1 Tax=Didymodactylos carnosus TaxID=1234261 RepID=A0A813VF58_9BILA|nr:unnamed protein product [Didymodactylos carnosus]CAF3632073.1 unnamed protein product [Didymodactylos carnosus]
MMNISKFGSIAFALIIIAFIFHILAMGYPRWKTVTCLNCANESVQAWHTSINKRCYLSELQNFSFGENHPLVAQLCLPNEYLYPKKQEDSLLCSLQMFEDPYTICALKTYTKECYCAYTNATQAIISLTVIASILLGSCIFISHYVACVYKEVVLKWLLFSGEIFLVISSIAILIALIISGLYKSQDLDHLKHIELFNNSE